MGDEVSSAHEPSVSYPHKTLPDKHCLAAKDNVWQDTLLPDSIWFSLELSNLRREYVSGSNIPRSKNAESPSV